ncbi:MAG: mechanosensitive ion channel [Thermoplasmata archaeon]|nr:mechanosensitive ion channel [Thermoplasmata archaeon]
MNSGLSIAITFIVLFSMLAIPFTSAQNAGYGTISGTVVNTNYDSGIPNVYITISNNAGYQQARVTDQNGFYSLDLPVGSYDIRAVLVDTLLENVTGILIGPNLTTTHDITTSFAIPETSFLEGYIENYNQMTNPTVLVEASATGSSYKTSVYTETNGHFQIGIPGGSYNVTIYDGSDIVHNEVYGPYAQNGHYWQNITVKEVTGAGLWSFGGYLINNWVYLIVLLAVGIGFLVGYVIIDTRLNNFRDGKKHKFSNDALKVLTFSIRVIYGLLGLYVMMTLVSYFWKLFSGVPTQSFSLWFNALMLSFILILGARLSLLFLDSLMEKIKSKRGQSKDGIPPTVFFLIHIVLKYAIIVIFALMVGVVLLSAIGLYDTISSGFLGFLSKNLGNIIFVVTIVIIIYLAMRFTNTFLDDLKDRDSKFSPQMIKMLSTGIKAAVIFIFGLIMVFTVLSMAGMQEMGTLIVILMTTMVGMIVAMAATGSIGNGLSGLILQSTKPYDKGDRVSIDDGMICDIIEVALLYTRVKTLNNEIVEVPNNLVLSSKMINYTRSGAVAIEIDVSIGYEVPVKWAIELLETGAIHTKSILHDPKPMAIAIDMGDYAITYKLRAYCEKPKSIPAIRSQVINNVQAAFYNAGVEILSPWYLVKREDKMPSRDDVVNMHAEAKEHAIKLREKKEASATENLGSFFDNMG